MRGVEREINPGWQKKAEKHGYPKTIQPFSNLSLKCGDQNNLGPIIKACHWMNQGYSQCPREDMELLAPVLWREVEHPQQWKLTGTSGGKSSLTVMAQQLMLQGTKSDYNDCLRVELYLPRACPVMEVKLNLSQIISLALWRS